MNIVCKYTDNTCNMMYTVNMSILNKSKNRIQANGIDGVLVGKYYGELLALRLPINERIKGKTLVECGCLGRELVNNNKLLSGEIMMCSVCRKTRQGSRHGMAGDSCGVYRVWANMLGRCHTTTHRMYSWYGLRGITVYQPWRDSFKEFLSDMGEPPEGMTLERLDNNNGYYPWNCEWVTQQEQTQNTRRTKLSRNSVQALRVCHKLGVSISVLAESFGINYSTVKPVLDRKTWSNIK